MKFAKRLEAEAVAEWRPKYLHYKQLKKLINLIAAARPTMGAVDLEKTGAMSPDEVQFFERLDADLVKIEDFYRAREKEAVDKKFKIMAQLQILPEEEPVKKKKKAADGSPSKEHPGNQLSWRSFQGTLSPKPSEDGSQSSSNLLLKSPSSRGAAADLPEHVKISSLRPTSFTHLARLRIKKALLEYYRSLELIRNFKTLNVLACAKILKKFDKNSGRRMSPIYAEKLRKYSFYTSNIVDSLMTDVENIYRWVFTEGDRAKALRKLRVKDLKKETFHGSATFSGFLLGACLALILRMIFFVVASPSYVTKMLSLVYFGLGLPFMMAWLFAVNAEVWEKYYVNYRFIFEFNQRNNLHVCQYSALVGIFSLLYVMFAVISLEGWMDRICRPLLQPWLVLGAMTLILIWPGNQVYRSSRIWFARVIVRIFTAPYYPCRFKDFFINDQYMSIPITFEVFGVLLYYTLNPTVMPANLDFPVVWYRFALLLLPGLWRSLQCLRRFSDSKMAFPHLANLAKYMCSLAVPVLVGVDKCVYKLYVTAIVARAVSSTFSLVWDIVMDFGLWQRSAVNDRLRNTILFRPWIYWYLILSDTIARYLWILPLVHSKWFPTFPIVALNLILWTIEALRRFQWNFFRVEYEHVNNCNVLRAVADVPLPFTATDLFYQDMVETIQQQREEACPVAECDDSVPVDGSKTPGSSIAGDDLDEEEYGQSLTYEQQLEMVQKAALSDIPDIKEVSPRLSPEAHGSGWSSPSSGARQSLSQVFDNPTHSRHTSQ